jgi:hypothetical protein
MKRHLPFTLKSILLVCFAGFLLAGCCSTHCVDCIPQAKMPYVLYDNGTKYYLTDHLSFDQMVDNETERESRQNDWPENLRKRFPNDKELMAYLDLRDERIKKVEKNGASFMDFLKGMGSDLKHSGGELYEYNLFGKKGGMGDGHPAVEDESGWLILSNGKIFKKYMVFSGLVSEDALPNGIQLSK